MARLKYLVRGYVSDVKLVTINAKIIDVVSRVYEKVFLGYRYR